jgi:3-hydroxybutyryl-CoA dehydratase
MALTRSRRYTAGMLQARHWKIGDSVQVTKRIGEADILQFAQLTGDRNPLHLDDEFAARTRFGRRIAHGMLSASLSSTCVGMHLPGPGAGVYLGQTLRFVKPVYPGDTITLTGTITGIREDRPVLQVETVWTNQHGEKVIEGEAQILLLE